MDGGDDVVDRQTQVHEGDLAHARPELPAALFTGGLFLIRRRFRLVVVTVPAGQLRAHEVDEIKRAEQIDPVVVQQPLGSQQRNDAEAIRSTKPIRSAARRSSGGRRLASTAMPSALSTERRPSITTNDNTTSIPWMRSAEVMARWGSMSQRAETRTGRRLLQPPRQEKMVNATLPHPLAIFKPRRLSPGAASSTAPHDPHRAGLHPGHGRRRVCGSHVGEHGAALLRSQLDFRHIRARYRRSSLPSCDPRWARCCGTSHRSSRKSGGPAGGAGFSRARTQPGHRRCGLLHGRAGRRQERQSGHGQRQQWHEGIRFHRDTVLRGIRVAGRTWESRCGAGKTIGGRRPGGHR